MRATMSCGVVVCCLLCLAVAWSSSAAGEDDAAVAGQVLAARDAPAANVVVRILGEGTPRRSWTVRTDPQGRFAREGLPPGGYVLEVDSERFGNGTGLARLEAGATTTLDIHLVEPSFDTATRYAYESGFIGDLPIIGHNYQDVLTLTPGVDDVDGDGNPNVHGARDTGMLYRLDGGDITDPATGTFAFNLDPLIIERVDVTTAGAPAAYGRANGGFTEVTTRSGGNDLEGAFALYWRGRALDGDGADNNDVNRYESDDPSWSDFRAAASLGGPILHDKLWYFASIEGIDAERPAGFPGTDLIVTTRGAYGFAKVSLQAAPSNKVALQAVGDPLDVDGLGQGPGASADSGYDLSQGGVATMLSWSSILSPTATLDAGFTHLDSGISVTPVSNRFGVLDVPLYELTTSAGTGLYTPYPCSVPECNPAFGERDIYQIDLVTGQTSGPFYYESDDDRVRNMLRADLAWYFGDALGEHRVRGGFEAGQERYRDNTEIQPILYDALEPISSVPGGPPILRYSGVQILEVPIQSKQDREVRDLSTGLYISDSWKPLPNLAINVGLRLDRDDLDAPGWEPFDPVAERRRSIALWRTFCEEAVSQGRVPIVSNCSPLVPYDGRPPSQILGSGIDSYVDADMNGVNDVAPELVALDLNQDGFVELVGREGEQLFKYFTTFSDRRPQGFTLTDSNISPRLGVSWDPLADGKTRLFGTWGRYYDRLLPTTLLSESSTEYASILFVPDPSTHRILPGTLGGPASPVSVTQVGRDLTTPYTDEWTLGVERDLAPEWSAGLTWIDRKGRDLLQDTEVNHYTCAQSGEVLGIDPLAICGDMGSLDDDRWGSFPTTSPSNTGGFAFNRGFSVPNGLPDLYGVSIGFNQVFLVENVNRSEYTALELKLLRRLHRNWQMQMTYTWSRARGEADGVFAQAGDDPSVPMNAHAYLGYDRRHTLKFEAATHLPHGLVLGGIVNWSSGTPWSVTEQRIDIDSFGNTLMRTFYPTGVRNDQRNGGAWLIDARLEKTFTLPRVGLGAFIIVHNLLDEDTLTIRSFDAASGLAASRDFGRRYEVGMKATF